MWGYEFGKIWLRFVCCNWCYLRTSWAKVLYRFLDNWCVREDMYEGDNNFKGCFRLVNFEEGIL